MTISSSAQKSFPGKMVELFDLDASIYGAGVHHFVADVDETGQPVVWRGNTYMPVDVRAEGYEVSVQGSLPRPILKVCHVNTALIGLVLEYNNLLKATVTHWKTFADHLDGAAEADPNAHFAPDIYTLNERRTLDESVIEWELVSSIDQEGRRVPFNRMTHFCDLIYRTWNGSDFDYTGVECPYTGANYFDLQNNPATAASDRCNKRLSSCKLRFPSGPLPFGGFPGIGGFRL